MEPNAVITETSKLAIESDFNIPEDAERRAKGRGYRWFMHVPDPDTLAAVMAKKADKIDSPAVKVALLKDIARIQAKAPVAMSVSRETGSKEAGDPERGARGKCGGCTFTWTPLGACHCTVCHVTFSGETYFNKHLIGDVEKRTHLRPTEIAGMTLIKDKNGIWGMPMDDAARKRMAAAFQH